MTTTATADERNYWRGVLLSGAVTRLPRWSLDARPAVGEHEALIVPELLDAVRRLADELAVPFGSVLLAAHAKALSALTGETEVTAGYARGVEPLPCLLSTAGPSWRSLVVETARREDELLAYAASFDGLRTRGVDGLRTGVPYETVFDPDGSQGELDEQTVLRVMVAAGTSTARLRLRYRSEVLDAACVARIAGYHLSALSLMVADPDADHDRQTLVGHDEFHYQIDGLAGRRRELPDRRLHQLFEEQVALHPDAVAAVRGDDQWTYAQLNARANRLARALLARGLEREGVVAVVTERTLDWLAAVLAVLKAGGAYLPIEPHFPAARIATTLTRAGCRLVLTEAGSTATLDEGLASLPGIVRLTVDEAYGELHDEHDLDVEIAPDQLAYLYFTSGSTGEPKGAMCEHAGMLNHVFAKIGDLGIGPDQVVAQTAPQCFDISLWQLVSALLVGGRTLLVEQEVILDVPRFVDTLVTRRVNVAQLVPSYLEAVLTYLDRHPHDLPDLRYVSVTGEALKLELAQRWFAAYPDIRLVNAYGLTETSDSTLR